VLVIPYYQTQRKNSQALRLTIAGTQHTPSLLNGRTSPSKPNLPKFDPKALLNPKAGAARPTKMQSNQPNGAVHSNGGVSTTSMDQDSNQPGMGSMMERFYGVTNRDAPLKRKSQEIEDSAEDEMRKESKTTTTSTGSSGEIGDYLKSERAKAVDQSGPSGAVIDLTNDDGDDDEVVITGETRVNEIRVDENQEVCLGRLHAKCNVFRIPVPPRRQDGVLGKETWPQQKVNFKRIQSANNIIDLFDRSGGNGTKFGMLEVGVASALCPLLDGSAINRLNIKIFLEPFRRFEYEHPGAKTSRLLAVNILLYAPRKRADAIGRLLSQKGQFLSMPPNHARGIEYFNPHEPKMLGPKATGTRKPQGTQMSFVTRTVEEMTRDATNVFDQLALHADDIPEMEPNGDIISTPLLPHQKQALHFMLQQEHADGASSDQGGTISLWKEETTNRGTTWYNIITNHKSKKKPERERGGILADMMGLGKTLSILSLIANTMDEAKQFSLTEAAVDAVEIERNVKTTLIICPKSVMSNWEKQIKDHTKRKSLTFYVYHGPSRNRDGDELAKYDIVLTTYNTASSDFLDQGNGRNSLSYIQWFRIVLDEGHQIRNQSTKISQACCALSAQRRWVVTGTPVQNKLDDLGSLFRFLRIKPFDDKDSWARYILAPFRNGNEQILQGFRLLVDSITLRRQKDKIDLKKRNESVMLLEFSERESVIYRLFASRTNMELKYMLAKDNRLRGKSYAHVLRSISRLRAICAHGVEMLSEEDTKLLEGADASTAIELGDEPDDEPDESFIGEKHAYEALQMMSDSEVDTCTPCGKKLGDKRVDPDAVVEDTSEDSDSETETDDSSDTHGDSDVMGYLTPCYHLICSDCKDVHIQNLTPRLTQDHYHNCTYCEQYVRFGLFELRRSGLKAMLDARNKAKGKQAKWDDSTYTGPHTKVKALLEDLKKTAAESASLPADEPPIRSVIFSGWTSYIDLIEHALDENDFRFVRLDGSMSLKARSSVLNAFQSDPDITILLVSIKAGGQGLNFTAASKVYMMEPQFNPGVELQAIDRVHRLGQNRDVDIVHYIMNDSVEVKILNLQKKKIALAEMSMEKKLSKAEEAKKRIEELHDLFK
jgi:SNF2 family DNA or RNA helicase